MLGRIHRRIKIIDNYFITMHFIGNTVKHYNGSPLIEDLLKMIKLLQFLCFFTNR